MECCIDQNTFFFFNSSHTHDVLLPPLSHLHIYRVPGILQGSPSGCGRREIPGVSQVGKSNARKKSHVVLFVAEKNAAVLYCEKGREVVSKNTYESLGIYQV